jgi:hypothetical protein
MLWSLWERTLGGRCRMLHCLTNQSLQRQRRLLPGLKPGSVPGPAREPQVRLHVNFSFLSLLWNIRTRGVQATGKHTTAPGLRKAKNPPPARAG